MRLKRGDVELHYDLQGKGEPVLFIQGIGVAGTGWHPQVEELSERWQTLTYDNRGLGRSVPCSGSITVEAMAADAQALMDAAGWESAHVVGHSMGGAIAQQLALDAPHRVRSLVLMCTFARGPDGTRLTPRLLWLGLRTRIGTPRMRRNAFLELLWPKAALREMDRTALAEQMARLIGRDLAESPPIIDVQLRALGSHDLQARLPELAGIPTLVMTAESDPIAREPTGRALAAAVPGAVFELVKNASHALPIQHPAQVNQRLEQHWTAVT